MPDTIPQSEYGGIHPELAARMTAARAVIGDFDRGVRDFANDPLSGEPDWFTWAVRLASDLGRLVDLLERLS